MNCNTLTLDVREDIRAGREPFSKIMAAAAGLGPEERLLLVAPFEPTPLFGVLAKQGFTHEAKAVASGDWEVVFTRSPAAPEGTLAPTQAALDLQPRAAVLADGVVEVDARGLEPPQPMVKILEAVSTLPPGAGLRARTNRRPMHLYSQLEQRGFTAETEEQSDGSYLTCIRRR